MQMQGASSDYICDNGLVTFSTQKFKHQPIEIQGKGYQTYLALLKSFPYLDSPAILHILPGSSQTWCSSLCHSTEEFWPQQDQQQNGTI